MIDPNQCCIMDSRDDDGPGQQLLDRRRPLCDGDDESVGSLASVSSWLSVSSNVMRWCSSSVKSSLDLVNLRDIICTHNQFFLTLPDQANASHPIQPISRTQLTTPPRPREQTILRPRKASHPPPKTRWTNLGIHAAIHSILPSFRTSRRASKRPFVAICLTRSSG